MEMTRTRMTCRDCSTALPQARPGAPGRRRELCSRCRAAAQLEQQKRWYRAHRYHALEKSRTWQRNHRERVNARPRTRCPVRSGRERALASLYTAAHREARRLGVDIKTHWFHWLSGSLGA